MDTKKNALTYTLCVELINGKSLLYSLDENNRSWLLEILSERSVSSNILEPLDFIWFQSVFDRAVIINVSFIKQINFLFDIRVDPGIENGYYDNFSVLNDETDNKKREPEREGRSMREVEPDDIPAGIVYLKGNDLPDSKLQSDMFVYYDLDRHGLLNLNLELENLFPMREFLHLQDDDGEEVFIPMNQIAVMEFNSDQLFMDGHTVWEK